MKKRKAIKIALWILLSPFVFIGFFVVIMELTSPVVSVTDLDYVDQYNDYKSYDYKLRSINTQDDPIGYYAFYYDNGIEGDDDNTYYICYPIKGESKDEFMEIADSYGGLINGFHDFHVYQNPDRFINVRKDWTIKEIQIYNRGSDLLYTITDKNVLQEFYTLYNDSSAPHRRAQYNDRDKLYVLYIRVIFNESESIVWQSSMIAVVYQNNSMAFLIDTGTDTEEPHNVTVFKRGELHQTLAHVIKTCFAHS